jgi:hypothetical protein
LPPRWKRNRFPQQVSKKFMKKLLKRHSVARSPLHVRFAHGGGSNGGARTPLCHLEGGVATIVKRNQLRSRRSNVVRDRSGLPFFEIEEAAKGPGDEPPGPNSRVAYRGAMSIGSRGRGPKGNVC